MANPPPPYAPPDDRVAEILEHEVVPVLESLTIAVEALVELEAIDIRLRLASHGLGDFSDVEKIVNRVRGCEEPE